MVTVRLTEFYHIDHDIIIACPHSSSSSPCHFRFADLQSSVLDHQTFVRCHPTFHSVRIDTVTPDLLFADIGLIFEWTKMTEIEELGQGAFGRVLKMRFDDASQSNVTQLDSHPIVPTCSSPSSVPSNQPSFSFPLTTTASSSFYAVKLLEVKKPNTDT